MQIHNSSRRYTEPAIAEADEWISRRACVGVDTAIFFPTGSDPRHSSQARKICADCPVKEPCLAYALRTGVVGIWAGTTFDERHQMPGWTPMQRVDVGAARNPIIEPDDYEHGRVSGKQWHIRNRIPMCGPCRDAWNAYSREYKQRQQAS